MKIGYDVSIEIFYARAAVVLALEPGILHSMHLHIDDFSHELLVKTTVHELLLFVDKIERDCIDVISHLLVALNLFEPTVRDRLEHQ